MGLSNRLQDHLSDAEKCLRDAWAYAQEHGVGNLYAITEELSRVASLRGDYCKAREWLDVLKEPVCAVPSPDEGVCSIPTIRMKFAEVEFMPPFDRGILPWMLIEMFALVIVFVGLEESPATPVSQCAGRDAEEFGHLVGCEAASGLQAAAAISEPVCKPYVAHDEPGSPVGDVGTTGCCRRSNVTGVDCSGFVQNTWGYTSTKLSCSGLQSEGDSISTSQLAQGDMLSSTYDGHCLLYRSQNSTYAYTWESTLGGQNDRVLRYQRTWSYLSSRNYRAYRHPGICEPREMAYAIKRLGQVHHPYCGCVSS